jgi:hypothetical protein
VLFDDKVVASPATFTFARAPHVVQKFARHLSVPVHS